MSDPAQYWSEETVSPPASVRSERKCDQVDAVLDEVDRPVAEQGVDPARVIGEGLLVLARLVAGRRGRRGPGRPLVGRHALIVRLAGGAERGARVGPSPVSVRAVGPPAGPQPADDRVLALEILADEPLVSPAHSMIATVLLSPSVISLMRGLAVLEHPLGRERLVAVRDDRVAPDAAGRQGAATTLMSV